MIEIRNLTKRYERHPVVDNLSFRSEPGEVLGFLGPNGAGKSTTMKMLTGFVAPSEGQAFVRGHDVQSDGLAARRCLGYLPEGAPCYPEMTPGGFLSFVADVRGLTGKHRRSRLDEVIGRLQLETVIDQSIDTLSKGFRRRVGLAQAILHDPDVLILDEPTDGLDPNQKHEVRELIRSMSPDKLIIISTHILEEVEAVCSRAIIIANGKILADDTPLALSMRSRYHNAVRLTMSDGEALDDVRAVIDALPAVESTAISGDRRSITAFAKRNAAPTQAWREVSAVVTGKDWKIAGLQLESGRLDEVFREITEGKMP